MKNQVFVLTMLAMVLAVGVAILPGDAAAEPGVVATIAVGDSPAGVAVNPSTNRIYVANYYGNDVSVINGATNMVIATIPVGSLPDGVAVNPSTNSIYVGHNSNHGISVIDGAMDTVVTTVQADEWDTHPRCVAADPNTNRIYAANSWRNDVSVIDGQTNTVVTTIDVGEYPSGVAVNPNTNRIYVANRGDSDTVSVIDGATDTVVAIVDMGRTPWGVAVNPNTNRIYVTIGYTGGDVAVIDGQTNTVVATVDVGAAPWGVAVNPNTNRIYVANSYSDDVSVIDGATNTMIGTIDVGEYPVCVAVNPTTNLIYVTNHDMNSVSVIQEVEDVAVTNVTLSETVVGQGASVSINVTLENQGDLQETFDVTTYYDNTPIETKAVTNLLAGQETTTSFTWNTTGVPLDEYVISAYAHPIPEETDIADNIYTDGTISVDIPYTLTITATSGGTTDPNVETHIYPIDCVVDVNAIPDGCYVFDHWELDANDVGPANPYSVLMDDNHTLHAIFVFAEITYDLTITATSGGTTDPNVGTYTYACGSSIEVAAIPESDIVFEHWELDGGNAGSANPYSVLMDDDHTLHGVFGDGDGIPDYSDNCPDVYNPDQDDLDFDGTGDLCDNCPDTYNSDQTDSDEDGIGDKCECAAANIDGKGPVNLDDVAIVALDWMLTEPTITNPLSDTNRDGIVDLCDAVQVAQHWLEQCCVPLPWSDCWNCPTQCNGDADCQMQGPFGQFAVFTNDLAILEAAYDTCYPNPYYDPCADFDRDGNVNADDMYIFLLWYALPDVPADCPTEP